MTSYNRVFFPIVGGKWIKICVCFMFIVQKFSKLNTIGTVKCKQIISSTRSYTITTDEKSEEKMKKQNKNWSLCIFVLSATI